MVEHKIVGNDMQAVVMNLTKGQKIRAEAGAMLYMNKSIKMETSTGGGIMKGLKRMMTRESFFITTYECTGGEGEVSFSGPFPGKIIAMDIKPGASIICQSSSYLCSTDGIEINIELTRKIGAGLFGGEGFILQRLEGQGIAFIHSGGTTIEKELAAGEELRVDTGCLVAFEPTVTYDIKFVGGIKTALFGGEGLFFAVLKGPGRVWIQSLPFSRLADRIISARTASAGERRRGYTSGR